MDVWQTTLEGTPLLEMRADIDHGTCQAVQDALASAIRAGNSVILLDLADVAYIDSGGLSVLFSQARLLPEGGWLGLISPNSNVHRLLEIVGLCADIRFRVFDDREAAAASLTEAAPR
jgi:anti-sigma B factor antagonist